ncbi:hypothetical protein [Rhodococcus sp. MEB064]|uniref:hypothetical protein n=1 Tax=Rhodococcus sp. MEB064 TaxID=1587522 RepID=UPI0005ACE969|nr:hypothetical protein [Rhodococcus sp. MEB064]KIQ08017.1 hypothetical protein RU01_21655 [Rhodococcus sp. MEB064]
MSITSNGDLHVRRAAAALAVISAGLHVSVLGGHAASSVPITVVTVSMIVGCVYCARHLWVGGAVHDWGLVAIMNTGMIAMHLIVTGPRSGGEGHGHGRAQVASSAPSTESMDSFMVAALACTALEVVLATSVLFYVTRSRDPSS